MHLPKTATATFTQTPQEVFTALQNIINNGKFKNTILDEPQRSMTFATGKTPMSWGREYEAAVNPSSGGSELVLTCGGVDGAPKAMLDGWKNGKAGDKFVAAVRAYLAS